jgi:purine-binding chemotaxis protein CheW
MSDQRSTPSPAADGARGDHQEFVTVTLDGQLFGIPVLTVQDVLGPQQIAAIPIAPSEVAGSLNLRGRIVTAIDPRVHLGLAKRNGAGAGMSVVVEHNGDLYSLLIDAVGEVLNLPANRYQHNPATLDSRWRDVSAGIYRLDDRLMVVLDVARLLAYGAAEAA